jgi:DNA-binding winged helix-turn-helix (wHTH) protein
MNEAFQPGAGAAVRFGRFDLRLHERRLLAGGLPVAIGSRTFDLLVALVERRERVVGTPELLDAVWPGLVVEDANVQVQVSLLRKVIGADAVATVARRGYRFVAPVAGDAPAAPRAPALAGPRNVTLALTSRPAPVRLALDDAAQQFLDRALREGELLFVLREPRPTPPQAFESLRTSGAAPGKVQGQTRWMEQAA